MLRDIREPLQSQFTLLLNSYGTFTHRYVDDNEESQEEAPTRLRRGPTSLIAYFRKPTDDSKNFAPSTRDRSN